MGRMRRTNYGAWVYDDGRINKNERAIEYIIKCAESVGIEIVNGRGGTSLNIQFMAEVMRRLKGDDEQNWEIDRIEETEEDGKYVITDLDDCMSRRVFLDVISKLDSHDILMAGIVRELIIKAPSVRLREDKNE